MQETWVQSLSLNNPLEEKMATHSSILAWEIPWTEEPGDIQSIGMQRVRHDWVEWTELVFFFRFFTIIGYYKILSIVPCATQYTHAQLPSPVWVFVTPWTVACQAPLSMGFPRQEYWSGLPFPSLGDLSNPGIEPTSPVLTGRFFTSKPPGKPIRSIFQ